MRAQAREASIVSSGLYIREELVETNMYACKRQLRKAALISLVLTAGLVLLLPMPALVAERSAECLACHSDKTLTRSDGKSVYVNESKLKATSHGQFECTDCHLGLDMSRIPHAAAIRPVTCVDCHSDARAKHTTHKDQVPQTGTPAEISAACKNCHGSHMAKPSPSACGECHPDAFDEYVDSVHGRSVARGSESAPVCIDCHRAGAATASSSKNSPVHPTRVPDTCSTCHASERINKEYDMPTRRLETYRESYHGIANRFGDVTVANCASCHGSHRVLPSSDPKSSVHKKNLPRTCGKCHPGANANYAKGKIHVEISRDNEPLLFYVSNGFKWLTMGTMAALIGHIGLDLLAKFRRRRSGRRQASRNE